MNKTYLRLLVFATLFATATYCAKNQTQTSARQQADNLTVKGNKEEGIESAEAKLMPYLGKYKMKSTDIDYVVISQEGEKLYGEASGQAKVELEPESADTFKVPKYGAKVVSPKGANQEVTGIRVSVSGYEVVGEKLKE